jgi:hypothetical protein
MLDYFGNSFARSDQDKVVALCKPNETEDSISYLDLHRDWTESCFQF